MLDPVSAYHLAQARQKEIEHEVEKSRGRGIAQRGKRRPSLPQRLVMAIGQLVTG